MDPPTIVWLRQDLRLADQAALAAAAAEGPLLPVYILDDESPRDRAIGAAQRWWLHHSLAALDKSLRELGSRLILRRGRSEQVLASLAEEVGTRRIHAIRHAEPWWRNVERSLGKALDLVLHDGNHLAPLGSVLNGSGAPYKIYSPFWRALSQTMPPPAPAKAPETLPAPAHWPASDRLTDWDLLPARPDWAARFGEEWTPGEAGGQRRLADFVDEVCDYPERRDRPSEEGSSRLSPHLHFGELSPARVWHGLARQPRADKFLKELAWRDYAANLIQLLPTYGRENGSRKLDSLPWRSSKSDLATWQQGRTGYPIVDAGMRQLWASGWMHNRVRMIAASFLVKHLLIDWRTGERWFWDTLVDADYGNNSVNWQWVAGTGVDANMFARIMAPLLQSEKFDAADYIRQWVPELRHLDDSAIHDPDEGDSRPSAYPAKLIGHREARERALAALAATRQSSSTSVEPL
jgi:deoxyribodipyrimidine photo-lyase